MKRFNILVLGAALVLAASARPALAQDDGTVGVMLFTGAQNTPAAFDVFRSTDYDMGVRIGGGLVVDIDQYVGVRGTFGYTSNSGQETGPVTGAIDFQRQYFSAELQLKYPVTPSLSPYLLAGGGLVSVSRESPDYTYDMTEGAATFGLGASYRIRESLSLFAEGKGWIYTRQTVGETQLDRALDVGLVYTLPL